MPERRQELRRRVYYGARLAFHQRASTMDCIVRNLSPEGAKLQMSCPAVVPDLVDLTIGCKGVAFLGRVIWRRGNEAGLVLHQGRRVRSELPLDIALRIRAMERANRLLRNQVDELRMSY